jgi:hypothetical protein
MPQRRGVRRFPFRDKPEPVPRKRMMAQGRKAHFMADMRDALAGTGLDVTQHRAFAETVFQRGTRSSTEAAHDYIREKIAAEVFSTDEANRIGNLIERYSFWR